MSPTVAAIRSTDMRALKELEGPCLALLRQTALFAGLSDAQLRIVAPPCRGMLVCKGSICFCQGEEAREMFVVLEGEICLEMELFMGGHQPPRIIEVERVGPNGIFGLCSLAEPRRSMLTARCLGDVKVVVVDVAELKALMKMHPAIGLVVLENAFTLVRTRLMRTHERLIAELGLAAMYQSERNY
jgi:CRP-like cAMP-binding protein